ncbi:unnamed protein product [Adineta ricciae]|uniref:Uncharacterized protein n=1 Tax=Adineta ricciae TaxID=249248 RepID=A0A813XEG8_ADIRI|nr:unnamed protein product [Adineta ricciae]CAF1048365.1 unnamed protein product [Adineta ricciae]
MVYVRACILVTLNFFQLIRSTSQVDDRALTIAASIDDYFCQNYVLMCFFRRQHHRSYNDQQFDQCETYLILNSCLSSSPKLSQNCSPSLLKKVKKNLTSETPTYCFTSAIYKTFYKQHLRSIASSSGTMINWQIFLYVFSTYLIS